MRSVGEKWVQLPAVNAQESWVLRELRDEFGARMWSLLYNFERRGDDGRRRANVSRADTWVGSGVLDVKILTHNS